MEDFDLALLIIGDLELTRRKALMALNQLQARVEELEAAAEPEDADK